MNFSQLHERLRLELLRRIERGTVSVSLLARQTGFGQSHVSNILHSRRLLSLSALDRVLLAQRITVADLLPAARGSTSPPSESESVGIPLVSHNSALFEPYIRPTAIQLMLHLPTAALNLARVRAAAARRAWQRFVAIRISLADALPMEPLIMPDAVTVIDRHYTSLAPYRPNRLTLYAIKNGAHLTLRYADFLANRLALRPLNVAFPVDLIEVEPGQSPNDLIIGRVAIILNEP